jgi:uncharacterized membrane protein YoaK (UPF0700 family)
VPDKDGEIRLPVAQRGDLLDLTAVLLSVWLVVLVFAGWHGPLAVLLTVAFAFFVPGRVIVSNWPQMAGWSEAAMSMLLSLAVLILLSTVTLWIHAWHPLVLFQIVAWLSLVGLVIGMARRHRGTSGAPRDSRYLRKAQGTVPIWKA